MGSFLDNTGKVLFRWLEGLSNQGLPSNVDVRSPCPREVGPSNTDFVQDGLAFCSSVTRFLWELVDVTNTHNFGEATFQIVLSNGREMIRRADPQHLMIKQLVRDVDQQFDVFAENALLKTGLSMEQMWKAYRPVMPGTLEGLQALQSLDGLAKGFAQIMWRLRVPVGQLSKLWQSLRQTASMICSEGAEASSLLKVCNDPAVHVAWSSF